MSEKILGREVKEKHSFKEAGTFQSMYAAQEWCRDKGYSYGSTCKYRTTGKNCPVAIVHGEYNLPQKWIHFDQHDENLVDGVMISNDWREGEVIVYIFN